MGIYPHRSIYNSEFATHKIDLYLITSRWSLEKNRIKYWFQYGWLTTFSSILQFPSHILLFLAPTPGSKPCLPMRASAPVVDNEAPGTAAHSSNPRSASLSVLFLQLLHLLGCRLLHPYLADWTAIPLDTHPFADAVLLGSPSHSSPSTANDQVPRAIMLVRLHPTNYTAVDASVFGNVSNLAARERPADRLPRTILLKIHATKRHIPVEKSQQSA